MRFDQVVKASRRCDAQRDSRHAAKSPRVGRDSYFTWNVSGILFFSSVGAKKRTVKALPGRLSGRARCPPLVGWRGSRIISLVLPPSRGRRFAASFASVAALPQSCSFALQLHRKITFHYRSGDKPLYKSVQCLTPLGNNV